MVFPIADLFATDDIGAKNAEGGGAIQSAAVVVAAAEEEVDRVCRSGVTFDGLDDEAKEEADKCCFWGGLEWEDKREGGCGGAWWGGG